MVWTVIQRGVLLVALWTHVLWASPEAERLLSILNYISRDYSRAVESEGHVTSDFEYEEMKNFCVEVERFSKRLKMDQSFESQVSVLKQQVDQKKAPKDVQTLTRSMSEKVIELHKIVMAPKVQPNLHQGKKIYESSCALCHGLKGDADTPVAKQLEPKPTSFVDPLRMNSLSPYQAFQTLTHGVEGTSMASFASLSESDRWALAAFVFTFRHKKSEPSAPAHVAWQTAFGLKDEELLEQFKETPDPLALLADVRLQTSATATDAGITLKLWQDTHRQLEQSFEAVQKGDFALAKDLALAAYLDHFEKLESGFSAQGYQKQVTEIEGKYLAYQKDLSNQAPQVSESYQALMQTLKAFEPRVHKNTFSAWAAFFGSFFILFREGAEIVLIISILLSCLSSLGVVHLKKWVHGSWVVSLILGCVTWFLFSTVLKGVVREGLEGWLGLFAAGVLMYVSFWLFARREPGLWVQKLKTKLSENEKTGQWIIFTVVFSAVYREVVEIVLFLQTLKIQAQGFESAYVLGLGAGVLGIALLCLFIFGLRKKIPLKTFFNLSSHVLFLLAVVFVGKAIHSLGEAGVVSQTPWGSFSVPPLGVYPFYQSLVPQLILLSIYVYVFIFRDLVKKN